LGPRCEHGVTPLTENIYSSSVSNNDCLSSPVCLDQPKLMGYNEGVALGYVVPAFQAEAKKK
ncbi:MAG TPA: hypothetical protein VG097_07115, partial [Gemmata sp.]|nr:hypothetical protein [Gemmata sp.]